jgi:hypothetical protein
LLDDARRGGGHDNQVRPAARCDGLHAGNDVGLLWIPRFACSEAARSLEPPLWDEERH